MSRPDRNPANEAPAAEVVEREPANAQALGSATVAEVESAGQGKRKLRPVCAGEG